MKNDWLCKCKHSREDHMARGWKNGGIAFGAIAACEHDQASFKDMCRCPCFIPMTNLEYLEQLSDNKGKGYR